MDFGIGIGVCVCVREMAPAGEGEGGMEGRKEAGREASNDTMNQARGCFLVETSKPGRQDQKGGNWCGASVIV